MLVYIVLLLILLLLFSKSYSGSLRMPYTIIGILFFSLIIGLRWDVGVDYIPYYNLAIGNFTYAIELERIEIIPKFLLKLCLNTSVPFYYWFIIMAFFQIFFIQKALRNISVTILCWGIFFFITMKLQEQMNIVRQGVALCVILYAYTFIHQKKLYQYILYVFLASLFHKSALICLPFYMLGNVKIKYPVLVQMGIFLSLSVVSTLLISYFVEKLTFLAVSLGYGRALDVLQNNELNTKAGSGLGIIFNYFRYLVLIYYSPKLISEYGKYGFNVFYTFLFIFMCFYSACFYSIYLQRIFIYFAYTDIVVFSFLYLYLFKQRHGFFPLILFMTLTLGQIVLYLIGGAPWQFIWDSNRIINFS